MTTAASPHYLGHEVPDHHWAAASGERVTIQSLGDCWHSAGACKAGRDNICPSADHFRCTTRRRVRRIRREMARENLVTVPRSASAQSRAGRAFACGLARGSPRSAAPACLWPMRGAHVIGGGAIGVGAALACRAFGANADHRAERPRATRKTWTDDA